jgi:hypothetical protein
MGISGIANAASISANALATRLNIGTSYVIGESGGLSLANVIQVTVAGGGGIAPTANNTSTLGGPAFRWTEVFAGNASFTGNVSANTGLISAANVTSSGNVTVTNRTTTANLTVSATANVANLNANGNTVLANTTISKLDVTGNATVGRNLTVVGNLIYNDQSTLAVEDPIIQLGVAPNNVPLTSDDGKDRGTELHTFGAELVTTVLAPLIPNNQVQLTDLGSNALVGLAFYSNAANGQPTWPANTTVIAWSGAANNTVTLSANRLFTPTPGDQIIIGSDRLEFMGYLNSANIFVVASDVTNNNNLITVNEYANFRANSITSANIAATGNITVTGNITANANITAVDRVTAANANITTLANIANLVANVANITTLTGGNANFASNVIANLVTANYANITAEATVFDLEVSNIANLGNVGNVKIQGGVANQYLQTDGNGNVIWQTISTNKISNGNTKVEIPLEDGDIILTANNSVIATFSNATASIGGNLEVTGTTILTGNANLQSSLTVANELAGNTANLSALSVNGNLSVTANGVVRLGNVGNVKITGGNSGQFLRTDGNGNLIWASGGGSGSPGGNNGAVQYNNDGSFAGDETLFAYDDTAGNLLVVGNVNGNSIYNSASLPDGPYINVNDVITTLPANIANGVTKWFLEGQTANQYQMLTVEGAYVIDGTLVDYYDQNGNTEFTGNVEITGNLVVGGGLVLPASTLTVANLTVTNNLIQSKWQPGEVIRTIALQQTGFNQSNLQAVGSTLTTIANYSYTPVSNNSRVYVRYSTDYSVGGAGADRLSSYVRINNNTILLRNQSFSNVTGGGTRSGTIFPIEAVYTNTGIIALNVQIAANVPVGDDLITIRNDANTPATLYIQEIQN